MSVALEISVPKKELYERLAEVQLGKNVALIVKPDGDEYRRININATATMVGDPFVFERPSPASTSADSAGSMARSDLSTGPANDSEFEEYVVRYVDGHLSVRRDGTALGELRSIVRNP